jgi:lysozyme
MEQNPFLDRLTTLLGDSAVISIYPCIGDLVANGMQPSRFSPSDQIPNRQDVTQYLAAWCRDVHISRDACRTWLCDYAVSTLASLSKSSASRIRHSTKSNVKYIYQSGRPFICGRENNAFRAACSKACPVYNEMGIKAEKAAADALAAMEQRHAAVPPVTAAPSGKEVFREQFLAAKQLVLQELSKGTKQTVILDILKQQGMKTRTGRDWTYATLNYEIRKIRQDPDTAAVNPREPAPMNPLTENLILHLTTHEGLRLKPYRCPAGKLTIGIGRNLEDKGITEQEARMLLENDIQECLDDLTPLFDDFDALPEPVRQVLVEMRFNLGPGGFRQFKKMIAAVNARNFIEAAVQMKDSRWYRQLGNRADSLTAMMEKARLPGKTDPHAELPINELGR